MNDELITNLKKYRLDNKMIFNNTIEYIEHLYQPIVTEPIVTEAIVTEAILTEPILTEPIVTEPIVTEAILTEPIVTEPIVTEPILTEPIVTEPIITENKLKPISRIYYPREKDSLFWCLYIMKYGYEKYNLFIHKNDINEKKLKLSWIELLRKNKSMVKNISFDTMSNIENNLVNEPRLSINTFMVLCSLDKFNVIIIHDDKKYYWDNKSSYNDITDENLYIIHIKQITNIKNSFGMECVNYEQYKEKLDISYLYIENWKKPIKSLSAYRLNELNELAIKLNIPYLINGKNKRKAELYEELTRYFQITEK